MTTRALVLRQVRYKEDHHILTLMTEDAGKLTAKARGSLRRTSRTAAACQALCYSEFTLFENRGRYTVNEAASVEQFLGLREDIALLALGSYFAELLETVCGEGTPDAPALRLALNALYALSRGLYAPEHIKSAFELRLMCIEGFAPALSACGVCGREEVEGPVFLPGEGMVVCRGCAPGAGQGAELDADALRAMRYIAAAPARRVFSFSLPEGPERLLGRACEAFSRRQLDKDLYTLDYWKGVK